MPRLPGNIHCIAAAITDRHKNLSVAEVNDHCLRLAVNQDATYEWHHHPDSDELFVVLEGELMIEFRDEPAVILRAGDLWSVPAGRVHRTIARGRTVNLCIEKAEARTVFG